MESARAQSTSTSESAGSARGAAEALFVEGKRLVAAGQFAEACTKFGESERLDAAPGTLLNLADCYEKVGRLASAWLSFREAAEIAQREDRASWADVAWARARLLEPRLPTLTVTVDAKTAVPGLEISRDGVRLAPSMWGVPVPVDPATSRIEVRAPKRKPWVASAIVDAEHPHVVLAVPELETLPEPLPEPAREPRKSASTWTPPRVSAIASMAVGISALSVAGALAITAKVKENQAQGEGEPSATNDSTLAVHEGNVATGLAVAGGVVTVAGIVLWLAAPSLRTRITFGGPAASLVGSF